MPKTSPQPLLSYKLRGIARVNPLHTRDMNLLDRIDYRFNVEMHRNKIVQHTTTYFRIFHESLYKLQHFGIIRSGDIPYLYTPPIPFFKRIGRRQQPTIGMGNFTLEPDIVRRRISPRQLRGMIYADVPIPPTFPKFQVRRSLRIAQQKIKLLNLTKQKVKQLAAESLLDGTFSQKIKSKDNLLGIACQDKSPVTLRDQILKAYKGKFPPKPNYWRRWNYPDEYTCHRDIHYFRQSRPFLLGIKPTDIRLQPIVRHLA